MSWLEDIIKHAVTPDWLVELEEEFCNRESKLDNSIAEKEARVVQLTEENEQLQATVNEMQSKVNELKSRLGGSNG